MKTDILNNLLVVDFTHALAGPYCTELLAKNGARVIKIERPTTGDMMRTVYPFDDDGISVAWASVNAGKESVELDLKSETDLNVVKNIIKQADVLVENFRPGVMDRLGLGYEAMSELNPKLIYTSVSGFGATGPMSHLPGFDLIGQGYSGLMVVNGDLEKNEGRVGFPIGDISAGMWAYMSLMTALYSRQLTGKGARVDISMLDGLYAMMPSEVTAYTKLGEVAHCSGNADPLVAPFAAVKTKDSVIIIAVLGDKLWHEYCLAIGKEELFHDPKFKSNKDRIEHRTELRKIVRPIFKTKTTAEWQKILTERGIPNGLVHDLEQSSNMAQIEHRQMLIDAGNYRIAGNPMKISTGTQTSSMTSPQALGESTQKVVDEFS